MPAPEGYVDVAERIKAFYEKYPEGALRAGSEPMIFEAGGKTFIAYHALAYRTPKDELPGEGWAWEPVPGPTNFTKDSELQNAETSAWGRAIVALGFETKHIASANEVRNRTGQEASGDPGDAPSEPQKRKLSALLKKLHELEEREDWVTFSTEFIGRHFGKASSTELTKREMGSLLDELVRHEVRLTADPEAALS